MRFLKDSPTIPDALLIARDEGRVVFFCGAGVSRARAGLSDFFGLADDVIHKLGVPTDNPACKILNEAREIDKRTGVSGLISADRIFGLGFAISERSAGPFAGPRGNLRLLDTQTLMTGTFVAPEDENSPPAHYARSTHTDEHRLWHLPNLIVGASAHSWVSCLFSERLRVITDGARTSVCVCG